MYVPTRLSRVPEPEVSEPPRIAERSAEGVKATAPIPTANTRGRAIRELNRAAEPPREPPKTRDRGEAREARREPRRDADQRAKRKQFAVHRGTVPTSSEQARPVRPDPAEERPPELAADRTRPPPPRRSPNYVLPGAILFGIAICVLIAVFIFKG